jgi:hypothetical protein
VRARGLQITLLKSATLAFRMKGSRLLGSQLSILKVFQACALQITKPKDLSANLFLVEKPQAPLIV